MAATSVKPFSLLSDDDIHWFNEGTHFHLSDRLGSHVIDRGGDSGTYFAVWAPNADRVSVIGDFNGWQAGVHDLLPRGQSGIWEGLIPGLGKGTLYKYSIHNRWNGGQFEKADPFARFAEMPPRTASIVWEADFEWTDGAWSERRAEADGLRSPISIYEVHLGSWMHKPEEGCSLSYREVAHRLGDYVVEMGFTHVEFLPVMEYPFYDSWGYQVTGYFAPTSRFGTPEDFKYLVNHLHERGIGVILDWVPSHFPTDPHGLAVFDGTCLYEHADPRQGHHPDWKSAIFNYGRREVRSFLISSALFWIREYHVDGLRVDGVASMLYLDYSRAPGEWVPNRFGGNENIEAVEFLKRFNEEVYRLGAGVHTFAEESTAWSMVSRPTSVGGLGFGFKWDMGWMHDTLSYMQKEPIHRRYHQNDLTFRMIYAYNENFVLSLSHDESVHGKGALLSKMPGDDWQKFANLRLLLGYMTAMPGKKLLFMGGEFGQRDEWNHNKSLDWHLLQYAPHEGVRRWTRDLMLLYRETPALFEGDCHQGGFDWIDCHDSDNSVFSFVRWDDRRSQAVLVVVNATPVPREGYRVGVPMGGFWREMLNGDAVDYGGSGMGNMGGAIAQDQPWHGRAHSILITLPPLSTVFFRNPAK